MPSNSVPYRTLALLVSSLGYSATPRKTPGSGGCLNGKSSWMLKQRCWDL